MTDFDARLRARLQLLETAIPAPVRPVTVDRPQPLDAGGGGGFLRRAKVRIAIAIALALIAASAVTANRVLHPDVPEPRLERAIAAVFASGECMTAVQAQPLVREAMDTAGYPTWTLELEQGADRARCVAAGVITMFHAVRLFPIAGRDVAEAMEWLSEQLTTQCLNRAEAIQLASSVMHSLGISEFEVRADPWGPQAVPLDKPGGQEAYIAHAEKCFVYSTVQQENGHSVIYLWGPWF
jgi:hypothetical protein